MYSKKSQLKIYKPPSFLKIQWHRYRLQWRRFKIKLSKIGILPAYLGEDVRWWFFVRRIKRDFKEKRYSCHLNFLVKKEEAIEGLRLWNELFDPRPPAEQPTLSKKAPQRQWKQGE